ncbi:Pr6Pr family membrane protein [Demequina sp. B12]|uniref:Pr6Pr family membrane protein n=1 Tax=Demequina sp. B12 TaxID=2992757 RepID=UPI00237A9FE8|nr:Pr6Pr family membrane protein [Demequina sp. B12]MDE0573128.1 Pr6Pr family membrane protein [Demequina sp. B12]
MSNEAWIRTTRLVSALTITAGLAVQAWADLTFGTFSWDQLPGYFTPLAALAGVIALLAAALHPHPHRWWIDLLRVNALTYLTIAGVVYWLLLAAHTTPKVPWANAILHGGAAVILLADWIMFGQRRRLPVRTWWTVLVVPALWASYLIMRASRDGWVPYPFLDPARGTAAIAGTLAIIAGCGLALVGLFHLCVYLRPSPLAAPVTGTFAVRPHARRLP